MVGDLVIISLAVVAAWAAYKLLVMETKNSVFTFVLAYLILAFLFVGIIVPNKGLIYGLFTPEIHGKLIDSESKQPVPNGDVVISWISQFSEFPYHNGISYPKSLVTKTDINGNFSGPSRHISLAIMFFPFYSRENSITVIRVFSPDYELGYGTITNSGNVTINMKKISSFDQILKKYEDCESFERSGSSKEKELARTYKVRTDRQREEYIKKYGLPKSIIDRYIH